LVDCYRSLSITLEERKYQLRESSALENLRDGLLKQLQGFDRDDLFNVTQLYHIQKRFDMRDLVPSSGSNQFDEATAENVHKFFGHSLFAGLEPGVDWSEAPPKGIGTGNYNIQNIGRSL
jgi:hypothetical protein